MTDALPPLRAADLTASPRDAPHLVVLVEDDLGDQVLFEEAVSDADPELQVRCVSDAEAVSDLVRDGRVSCILLDLGLPGLSGFEALDLGSDLRLIDDGGLDDLVLGLGVLAEDLVALGLALRAFRTLPATEEVAAT